MKKFIFITGLLMSIFFYSCKEEDHGILPPIDGGGTVEVRMEELQSIRQSIFMRYEIR